ncbi:MAG: ATP-binding protein [Gemmatimonadales bacterium]
MAPAPVQVLVVEDENIVAMDLRANLEQLGYTVTATVGTATDAIRSAADRRPDLVLMDIKLRGDMDGTEAADRLRREFNIPVVYLTAYSDDVTLQRARVTEPLGYLLKPFDERELHIVVEMALHQHRAQQQHEQLLREQVARTAMEHEQRWTQFLADAGAALAASLEVQDTLRTVVELAVPELADWAAVHLQEPDGVRTVAVRHVGGADQLGWELLGRLPPDTAPYGYLKVMRSGEPELLPEIGPEVIAALAVDADHGRQLEALQLRAQMCVPLEVRGEIIGAITFATAESQRSYTPEDVGRAMELARRCASAMDNARLHAMARGAIQMRDEFLSVAAHELRTPLSALMLAVHTMDHSARQRGDADLSRRCAGLMTQCKRLARLVDRLLDVSRITTGKLETQLEELDLAHLVRETAAGFVEPAERVGSHLLVQAPPRLVTTCDPLRLEQVLTNLLANAMKFGPGQPIEVTLDGDDAHVQLTVRDYGVGIPKDRLSTIFDRFERGVSTRSYGGLGLGLYVTRQIVAAHGGTIAVESEPGQGALFRVRLPRCGPRPD